jgi:hypothetical protein
MSEVYTILTPLPQIKLRDDLPDHNLGDDLSIRPLKPQLRRCLLNIAKEQKCSDDCLLLLSESELVFCAQIPTRKTKADSSTLVAAVYSTIAEEILKRIFRCLLLFEWVPEPLLIHCWFYAAGVADDINTSTLKMIDPKWEYIDLLTNIDWRSGNVEPEDITLELTLLLKYWDKLSEFCQIDLLKSIFTDKKKEKGIFTSANQYVKQKVEELMKAKYGPDASIVDNESNANAEKKSNGNDLPKTKISNTMWSNWFFPAFSRAYSNEVDKLSQELNKRVFNKRFDRAFQFFTDAFRVTEPHRFISFVTCLESLFCTSRAEITFQIASRVAWFLSPGDCEERSRIFTKVKSLYGVRSEIVHGIKYNPDKIEKSEVELITLLRRAFRRVLSDDSIYSIFRGKEQEVCNKYLEELSLGISE